MYNLIACVNKKGLLGQENDLYANSSKDLHYFSQVTKGHNESKQNIIVMGYYTWLSLPRKPLKDRYNIILTKNHTQEIQDICNFPSLDRIFTHIEEIKDNFGEVFIIGGGSVYKQCLDNYPDKLNKLYITEIDDDWCGDEHSKYFNYSSILSRLDIIKERVEPTDTRIYDPQTNTYIVKHVNLTFRVYQKKELINKDEYKYLQLMDSIMKQGLDVEGRNGVTKSLFGEKMVFDLSRFPLLTTKKMGYKTILRELLWFIKGSTNNQELKDKNVHIWDGNASKSFLESRGLSYEQDDLGPIYGFQWRHFGAEYKDRYTDYSGKGYDQLKWLINEIKENPNSRRLILSAWNPSVLDQMALPPCHILCQFYVNQKENTLSCQLYQRSGDMFLGIPFNITSYAFLTYILCKLTGYKPGKFHHIIGDAHIYEEHDTSVLLQIKRVPKLFPILTISDRLTDIDDIDEGMFKIENYESYSKISAPMKV
jgi:dihydrofolate reductase / thymidylate synthase